MIYLDNAATSWPKPDTVIEGMSALMRKGLANPGRGGHRLSVEAEEVRYETRELVCEIFGVCDPLRIVFTGNATSAINIVLLGYLSSGDRVIVSSMEHNAVMRPLCHLEACGISFVPLPSSHDGALDIDDVKKVLDDKNPPKLIVMAHASNVTGTIMPIGEIGALARERGVPLLVDAAQTGGCVPIEMEKDSIDIIAFTGHKSLLGPTGTGGLIFGSRFDVGKLAPTVFGGTGSRSEEEYQPDFLPDKFEGGTANIAGIAGLREGIRWILEKGVGEIRNREIALEKRLSDGLRKIEGVTIFGSTDPVKKTAIVSFVIAGKSNSEVGERLSSQYDIMARVGLHCAPRAHRTIGTFPEGTVRFSPGVFTTDGEIDEAIEAVCEIAGSK